MASHHDPGYYFVDDGDVWHHSVGRIIALFVLIVIFFLIYFYAWTTYRRHSREASHPSINGVSTTSEVVHSHPHPIDSVLYPSIIASLPTFVYKSAHQLQGNTNTVECAVCLSNLEEGDMVRLIPTCKHTFHLQCINMWFSSHSTCPICRSAAQASSTSRHHEMNIWVPSMVPLLDSVSHGTECSEGTSDDASSQTSMEDAYMISIDVSSERAIQPQERQQTDGCSVHQ